MTKYIWSFTIILCIIIGLFISSSQSSGDSAIYSSQLSNIIQQFLNLELDEKQQETFHFLLRKTAHFLCFFLLGLTLSALFQKKKNYFSLALLLSICIAIIDETHQFLGGTRNGTINDVILDTSGAFVGCFLYIFYKKRRYSERKNRFPEEQFLSE